MGICEYYPGINKDNLLPDYVGIKPKVVCAHDPAADFEFQFDNKHYLRDYVALYGIESPGLTASLAIGDYVTDKLNNKYSLKSKY